MPNLPSFANLYSKWSILCQFHIRTNYQQGNPFCSSCWQMYHEPITLNHDKNLLMSLKCLRRCQILLRNILYIEQLIVVIYPCGFGQSPPLQSCYEGNGKMSDTDDVLNLCLLCLHGMTLCVLQLRNKPRYLKYWMSYLELLRFRNLSNFLYFVP